jgi:hypothetical protein
MFIRRKKNCSGSISVREASAHSAAFNSSPGAPFQTYRMNALLSVSLHKNFMPTFSEKGADLFSNRVQPFSEKVGTF